MHHRRDSPPPLERGYDIREIDEDLYVAVLARCRAESAGGATDLADASPHGGVTAGDSTGQ